jgi:hypothetical protein
MYLGGIGKWMCGIAKYKWTTELKKERVKNRNRKRRRDFYYLNRRIDRNADGEKNGEEVENNNNYYYCYCCIVGHRCHVAPTVFYLILLLC